MVTNSPEDGDGRDLQACWLKDTKFHLNRRNKFKKCIAQHGEITLFIFLKVLKIDKYYR
jgi:hypothetical protein